ncbi:MAG TPA: hypothetical protein VH720_02085 [Candidatus Limnocylindrales bacterium]|jgi:hypothetical protein
MTEVLLLPAHVVGEASHDLPLAVAAFLVSGIGAVSLASAWLERRGVLDGASPSVGVDRWAPLVASAWSVGAAAIHFAVIGEHLEISALEAVLFALVAAFQLGWAAWYLLRPSGWLASIAVVINLGVVGAWAWSRTIGLPLAGEAGGIEPVGVSDSIATGLELALIATLLLAAGPVRDTLGRRLGFAPATAVAWVGSAVVAAAVLGSTGVVQGATHDHPVGEHGEEGSLVVGAPGTVTFGSQLAPAGGVADPSDSLPASAEVLWVVVFREPTGSDSVQLVVDTVAPDGSETERLREDVFLARLDTRSLTEVRDLATLGGGPGRYRVRYELAGRILAEGDVTLVP